MLLFFTGSLPPATLTCLQVRLPDGTSLTQTFRAREQLAAVRLYVELHRGEEPGGDQDPVQLLSGFPRRAFSEADMERPLQDLGMTRGLKQDLGVAGACLRRKGCREKVLGGEGVRPGVRETKRGVCGLNLCSSFVFRTRAFCCPHCGQEMSQLRGLYPPPA